MGSVHSSVLINAPQEDVFDLVTDIPNAEKNISGITKIEMLSDGPVGIGTRWRETRVMMKKEATEEMEITAFDRPNSYTIGCESCGARYTTDIRCVPESGATRLEMRMSWKPVSFGAKVMAPLGMLMQGMMRKCLEKDLQEIKTAAEAAAPAAATA